MWLQLLREFNRELPDPLLTREHLVHKIDGSHVQARRRDYRRFTNLFHVFLTSLVSRPRPVFQCGTLCPRTHMVRFVHNKHMRRSPNNLAIVFAPCTPRKYSETSPETECLEVIIIQLRDSSRIPTNHPAFCLNIKQKWYPSLPNPSNPSFL